MKVKELVEKLQEVDQEMEVWLAEPGFNCSPISDVEAKKINIYDQNTDSYKDIEVAYLK